MPAKDRKEYWGFVFSTIEVTCIKSDVLVTEKLIPSKNYLNGLQESSWSSTVWFETKEEATIALINTLRNNAKKLLDKAESLQPK